MQTEMQARALTPDRPHWAAFEAALRAARLPTDDLAGAGQCFFSFADAAAFGGFAQDGPTVLLRSLVIASDLRGRGLGGMVLSALLREARGRGGQAAWLLTTSAQGFFARHGFVEIDRSAAPSAVAASPQFTGLCPASAVLMCRKPL